MIPNPFSKEVEKFLCVGGPKRSEILAEIQTHLDEPDSASSLGNPRAVAEKLNRVHIGWGWQWWSPLAVAATWLSLYLVLSWFFHMVGGTDRTIAVDNASAAIWFLRELLNWIVPVGAMMYYGRLLPRLHRPHLIFSMIVAGAVVAEFVALLIGSPEVLNTGANLAVHLSSTFITSLMMNVWTILALVMTMIIFIPRTLRKITRPDMMVELASYLLSLVLGYFVLIGLTQFILQPFDGWLTEQRPIQGSFLLEMNNYFERGWNPMWALTGYILLVTVFRVRRLLQYPRPR